MKLNELPKKKMIILLAGAMAIVPLMLIISAILSKSASEETAEEPSISQPIPEAEPTEEPDGKTDSYVRSGITEYWDSLDEQKDENMTADDRMSSSGSGRRPGQYSVEDIFGDVKDTPEEEPVQRSPAQRSGGSGSRTVREKPSDRAQKATESRSEAPSERVQVKKSGAISSLDDDVVKDLGNGFSTLDGSDMWVQGESGKPYRCMFTRDEKVSSGQRISLRLLEDLVIGGVHVPQNTHLQGVCKISDRMEVAITSLDMGGRILSFHFEAYDTDGGKGIYCSDLSKTTKEITNQGVNTALSSLNSRIGSAARDAATLGASIVRSKSGEVTVSVPAGYTFYIVEEKKY